MKKEFIQWIEINSSAFKSNIDQFKNLIGANRKLLIVVKANAYGHGIIEISRLATNYGADWLGVNSIEEGLIIKENKIDLPILILGYVQLSDLSEVVENNFRLVVYNKETIKKLGEIASKKKKKVYIHIKLETGTHRQGIRKEELLPLIKLIKNYPYLFIEGISTHFANIEDTTNHTYAQKQLDKFNSCIKLLKTNKISIQIKHTACTAATILFPETYFDMVRVGIGIYGLWPSKETYLSCLLRGRKPVNLKPILTWKTKIAQIKNVPEGSFIGYGCTYKTTRPTKLAVLPVGYYDGYDRKLSNSSYVLIKGKRAPLRGRVAMNMITVDITDIPGVKLEDEVVLLGNQGNEIISAEYLASLCGTINYEIVTRINPSIPRIVL
ncbi:alanine racemase [Candidatus Aminicenantes bacterium AH-873-B07]|nr:alanine racemase [Candidatus Aminicenantes bacterium AH-873-B07]